MDLRATGRKFVEHFLFFPSPENVLFVSLPAVLVSCVTPR